MTVHADAETILLIDDEPEIVEVLREHLQSEGYRVVSASSCLAGMAALRAEPVALVLLDLLLRDGSGIDVMRAALRLDPAPAVIIVTGHATVESAVAAVDAGASGYLTKPVDLSQLGAHVAAVLGRRRLALENASLHDQLAERLRETEALLAISETLTSTIDLTEALRRISRELSHLTGADTVAAYLHDRATDLLRPCAAYQVPPEYLNYLGSRALPLREQGFHLPVWRDRRPVDSDDVAHDPRFKHEMFHTFPHQSGVLLPLLLDEDVAGAFYLVWWRTRRRLSDPERVTLEGICGQVGLLLRNARLFEQTEGQRRRLATLYEIAGRLAAVHDREQLLSLIVDELTRVLNADGAAIRLVEDDRLVMSAHTESARELVTGTPLKLGEGLTGRVLASGEPVVVEDVAEDLRVAPAHRQRCRELGFHGFMAAPLRAGDQPIGTLSVYTRQRQAFGPDDVSLLSAFADQAALAIEKARLYDDAQSQRVQLRQILESTSDGIVLVGRDGVVAAVNQSAGELLGFSADAVLGDRATDVLAYLAAAAGGRTLVAALGAMPEIEPWPAGDVETAAPIRRVLHWSARPTRDAAGDRVGVTVTFQDVTQEREISQMKSDFVSFVTHQLRTPLAGIKWLLELAERSPDLPEDTLSYLQDSRESATRLTGLVNDLLDVSRLEAGRLVLDAEPVRLDELTRSILDEAMPLIDHHGHRLVTENDTTDSTVTADPRLLRQAFTNLLSNAAKYTLPGGTITVRIGREGGDVTWVITDSGIGIPSESQARLFEKFYRADNVRTIETEGTGLGLYLVRLILKQFGGAIRCESEEGRGSAFIVTLPAAEESP